MSFFFQHRKGLFWAFAVVIGIFSAFALGKSLLEFARQDSLNSLNYCGNHAFVDLSLPILLLISLFLGNLRTETSSTATACTTKQYSR